MLHLSSILKSPYTGTLKVEDNEATVFEIPIESGQDYKWCFSRALNEENGFTITEFDSKSITTLLFNGLIDNPDGRFIKLNFDIRVRFLNGTDFSLTSTSLTTKSKSLILNKKLKVSSRIDKFIFQPYKDIIYIQVNVKDMISKTASSPIKLKFTKLGFSLISNK